MKVRRERPSQRLNHRISAPVRVETPEGVFRASDWGLGGFAIEGYPGKVEPGDSLACTLHIPFQGFDISFPMDVEVKRMGADGGLGVAFSEVGDREREIMSHFVDDLVRGSMATIGDTILRIDSPVTPVPTEPDPNPADEVPLSRRSLKTWAASAFYFSAGAVVIAYALLVFQSNFLRLEVDTAVVSAPIESILATADGRIQEVAVEPGRPVDAGAPLIAIEDAGLNQTIELAQVQVDRAVLELRTDQKTLQAEQERLRDYHTIALAQIERTSTRIRSLEEQASLALDRRQRFDTLFSQGWTTRSKLDEVSSNYAELAGRLEEARSLMHERRFLLDSIEQGRFFTGGRFEGQLKELQAEVDLGIDEVMLAKDELSALKRHRQRLVLTAPTQGRIVKLLKSPGSSVKRGEEIALYERDEDRTIEAFLTQEEVLEIGLGDAATVYFPSLDQRVGAFVIAIDRSSGYIDEINSRYVWRGPKDRSAIVRLLFEGLNRDQVRRRFTPGLPAVVVFERRNTDETSHRIRKGVDRLLSPGQET